MASRSGSLRNILAHVARVGLLSAVLGLIHDQHVRHVAALRASHGNQIDLEPVRALFPAAVRVAADEGTRGAHAVFDAQGRSLGFVVRTSPFSDHIIGYSGPTNTLVAFDDRGRVTGMRILSSGDTRDHVALVRRDPRFLSSLRGRTWEEAGQTARVDAVSGATLTSLAILESVAYRLGGRQPSLRFPREITLAEAQTFFPDATRLVPRPRQPALLDVVDGQGQRIGTVLRSSPAADHEMGYQGPTDTLLALGSDDRVRGLAVRDSFDNDRYVGFVREDDYFREIFNGRTLGELAELDLKAAQVEGVSGATMTSMAVARGLTKAARAAARQPPAPQRAGPFQPRDLGTVAVLVLALVVAFTPLRGRRGWRLALQCVLIGYLGFVNGDMVSQALLVGWAQSGVAWRSAPGLAILSAAALTIPIFSKSQFYCHHVCPFGAAQQLVRNRLPWRWSPPRLAVRLAESIPPVLLGVVIWTAMRHGSLNLASLEPFDAFLFRVAGLASLLVAAGGLLASAFVPMAYCRFGCPTGALLNYLRFHAGRGQFFRRDAVALVLLGLALLLRGFGVG